MRKRIFPFLLFIAISLLLAGCGGGSNKAATADQVNVASQAEDNVVEEDVPFTISGTVTDEDGRGIPGITIATFPRGSTTTDDDGHWSLSDLTGAGFSLYPSHADFTFEPESYQVEGPETAIHFTAIAQGCPLISPCKIRDVHDLQNIQDDLEGHYVLVNDIDASETMNWNDGQGFEPIGSRAEPFAGTLDGDGFEITGLHIDRLDHEYVALFAVLGRHGEIRNLGLADGRIAGNRRVTSLVAWSEGTIDNVYNKNTVENYSDRDDAATGGLVSRLVNGTVRNSYNAGTVTSISSTVAGLVSQNIDGTIENSYNEGTVTSPRDYVGGVAAENTRATITNSYNTGSISGGATVGGVAASNSTDSYISHSYNTGSVTGTGWNVGGVAGRNSRGTIEYSSNHGDVATTYERAGGITGDNGGGGTIAYSYNTGNVEASQGMAGGIAGENSASAFGTYFNTISNSYSTGEIQGATKVGGLVGLHHASATIEYSYSTSSVSVTEGYWDIPHAGGLVGEFEADRSNEYPDTIVESFYDTDYFQGGPGQVIHTEQGIAKTKEELKTAQTFTDSGWDFDAIWTIDDGTGFPDLIENPRL